MFHLLVDSDKIMDPLRQALDSIGVCRSNILTSKCTIIVAGKRNEDNFFADLLSAGTPVLTGMTFYVVRWCGNLGSLRLCISYGRMHHVMCAS